MKQFKKSPIILIVLMALALLATACTPSAAEKYNKEGNDAFTKQAYEEALAAYQTAQIKEPELAEPYYNAANALYRQGIYDAALEQLQIALSFADEESLAQSSFFNMGNSSYNAQDLGTAVAAYTEALLINPDDQDAKYNLELALQQQQEQQQEQEQEQQEEQEQEQSQNGEGEEEQQQQDQSQDGEGQKDQQEQQEQSQDGEGQENQQEQQQGQEQSDEGQEGEQEQESEQSEGDQSQDGEPQDGQEEQEQQGQPQPGEENPNQEGQPSQMPAPGQRMTEEQAEQLLAAIAENSDTLQERLGQIFVAPWGDPVQDW